MVARWSDASFAPGEATLLIGERLVVMTTAPPHSNMVVETQGVAHGEAGAVSAFLGRALLGDSQLGALPGFAMVVAEAGIVRLIIRGDFEVTATNMGGEAVVLTGAELLTWAEHRLDGVAELLITDCRPGARQLPDVSYRASEGVLPASAIKLTFEPEKQGISQGGDEGSPDEDPTESDGAHNFASQPRERPAGSDLDRESSLDVEVVDTGATLLGQADPIANASTLEAEPSAFNEDLAVPRDLTPSRPDIALARDDANLGEAAEPPTATGNYDDLFGPTMARSVEGAARRPAMVDEPGSSDKQVMIVGSEPDDPAHDGETIGIAELRALRQKNVVDALEEPTNAGGLLAVSCGAGHRNPPFLSNCRICGSLIFDQKPESISQPVLARISGPGFEPIRLDRKVLVGRSPRAKGHLEGGITPELLVIASPEKDVSRTHLELNVEGWSMLVTDLDSANGTMVELPGRPPVRLRPGEAQLVEIGSIIRLADEVELRLDAP